MATSTLQSCAALLNLGCGSRFHSAWTNLDLVPIHPTIRRFDVTWPLPFADGSFDAVYHSHLLEHIPREHATPFLRECRRVLRPGGVLRIAVPDLESIARLYLTALEDAAEGDVDAQRQHRWLVTEMYDQTTRETPGGEMLALLQQQECDFAWHRLGADGTTMRRASMAPRHVSVTWRTRVHAWLFGSWRERLIRWLLRTEYPLLQLGRFRRSGEVHHWMYDRVSLRTLLLDAGFVRFRGVGPRESAIPSWNEYHLDVTEAGEVCKPDSLFVEAERSGTS